MRLSSPCDGRNQSSTPATEYVCAYSMALLTGEEEPVTFEVFVRPVPTAVPVAPVEVVVLSAHLAPLLWSAGAASRYLHPSVW